MREPNGPLKAPTAARTHEKDVLREHLTHHGDGIELRATKSKPGDLVLRTRS
jgi:hypothetical protein